MKPYTATARLCTPEETVVDRVQANLRAYRTSTGTRWGGELTPEEGREPARWPEGEVILELPGGRSVRATAVVVSVGQPDGAVGSGGVGFHQMARIEGIGPPPEECL